MFNQPSAVISEFPFIPALGVLNDIKGLFFFFFFSALPQTPETTKTIIPETKETTLLWLKLDFELNTIILKT